jgi:hypothetical protein
MSLFFSRPFYKQRTKLGGTSWMPVVLVLRDSRLSLTTDAGVAFDVDAAQVEARFSRVLGTLGVVAGLISWLPLTPLWTLVMKMVAGVAGGLSTLLTCLSGGLNALCVVSIVLSVIGYAAVGLPGAVTNVANALGRKTCLVDG